MDSALQTQEKIFGLSLIAAPALLGISTFFWNGSEVGLAGGTVLVYAFVFWIPALLGLFWLLRPHMPRLAAWGILLACFTCIGGANWATDGIYPAAYRIAGASIERPALLEAMGATAPFILFIPGLLFPLTLITLGIALFRTHTVPAWCAVLLILGGIGFPASRIPRIEMLAHIADLLLFLPMATIGWRYLTRESAPENEIALAAARSRA